MFRKIRKKNKIRSFPFYFVVVYSNTYELASKTVCCCAAVINVVKKRAVSRARLAIVQQLFDTEVVFWH